MWGAHRGTPTIAASCKWRRALCTHSSGDACCCSAPQLCVRRLGVKAKATVYTIDGRNHSAVASVCRADAVVVAGAAVRWQRMMASSGVDVLSCVVMAWSSVLGQLVSMVIRSVCVVLMVWVCRTGACLRVSWMVQYRRMVSAMCAVAIPMRVRAAL